MLFKKKGYVKWNFMWHYEYIKEKKKDFEVVGFFPNTFEGECICVERGLV